MKRNDIITLVGITHKGKNKIREHGGQWRVILTHNNVQCLNNKPGVLLQSTKDKDIRWIAVENDVNFRASLTQMVE